jgi:hypothetical protein
MNDPLIDEIRRARREISDEIGPDLVGLVELYCDVKEWWVARHPGTDAAGFGVQYWDDWQHQLLHGEDSYDE